MARTERKEKNTFEKDNAAERNDSMVIGRNPVTELLKSDRPCDKLLVAKGEVKGSIGKIIAMAKEKGVLVKDVSSQKLDLMCGGASHQGVIAFAAACEYASMDDIFKLAEEREEAPFIIIADELEDPHNLGAVIRTAECCGAHGIIIPKRRSVGLTSTVFKTSAGAAEYVPVVRVANLASAIDELKERGVWIYAADMDGENWCSQDYSGAVGLVVGSEGRGVGRLICEKCDFTVSLPMRGKISSLNASVAASVLMYEIARQRLGIKAK